MLSSEDSVIEDLLGDEGEGLPWSVTYADLMTLLLVFFILLYTIFLFQTKQFEARLAEIQVVVDDEGRTRSMLDFARARQPDTNKVVLEQITGLRARKAQLFLELEAAAKQQRWDGYLHTEVRGKRLLVSIDGAGVFPESSAQISDLGLVVLYSLLEIFERYPEYQVNVQEHSKDRSDSIADLSSYRAAVVLRYFIDQGFVSDNMTATGYGDLLADGLSAPAVKFSSNRRLDFVLEKEVN